MLRVLREVSKILVLKIAPKTWILDFLAHSPKIFIVLFHTFLDRIPAFPSAYQWLWRQAFKILLTAPIRMSP